MATQQDGAATQIDPVLIAVQQGQLILAEWAKAGHIQIGQSLVFTLQRPQAHLAELYLLVQVPGQTVISAVLGLSPAAEQRVAALGTSDRLVPWLGLQTWEVLAAVQLATQVHVLHPRPDPCLYVPN